MTTQTQEFIPATYEVPESSAGKYMKLKKGANLFRVLASPIMGWESWVDNKPIRKADKNDFTQEEIGTREDGTWVFKHFWAMPVWNYEARAVQILTLTQKGIQRAIRNLARDEDWGSATEYDISITRTGEGFDTEYAVAPKPHKQLPDEAKKAWINTPIKLENYYGGGDPFIEAVGVDDINPEDIPF